MKISHSQCSIIFRYTLAKEMHYFHMLKDTYQWLDHIHQQS